MARLACCLARPSAVARRISALEQQCSYVLTHVGRLQPRRLLTASLADKAITFKMPHPDFHQEGVPDEEEQASPREQIKRKVQSMLVGGGSRKIQ